MDSLAASSALTQVAAVVNAAQGSNPAQAPRSEQKSPSTPASPAATQSARTISDTTTRDANQTVAVASRQNLQAPQMASEAGRVNEQAGRAELQSTPASTGQTQTQSQSFSESPAVKPAPGGGSGSRLDTRA